MSVTLSILETYRAPRRVMRRQLAGPESEARAKVSLMLACLLIVVSQWPRLSREAVVDPTVPLEARMGGALLGWIFVATLFYYLLAGLSFMVARVFGGQGTGYGARLVLFWALLAISPLWMLHGLLSGFLGSSPQLALLGLPLLLLFLAFWLIGLREAVTPQPVEGAGGPN